MTKSATEHELENQKFFSITQTAYYIGFFTHSSAVLLFWLIDLPELMWFNLLFCSPAFGMALWLNKKGKFDLAFTVAFLELLFHQIFATYYLGWDVGAHFWLIYLAGLSFFNANWT